MTIESQPLSYNNSCPVKNALKEQMAPILANNNHHLAPDQEGMIEEEVEYVY